MENQKPLTCSHCGNILPYVPTTGYKFYFQNGRDDHYFCDKSCQMNWYVLNPNFFEEDIQKITRGYSKPDAQSKAMEGLWKRISELTSEMCDDDNVLAKVPLDLHGLGKCQKQPDEHQGTITGRFSKTTANLIHAWDAHLWNKTILLDECHDFPVIQKAPKDDGKEQDGPKKPYWTQPIPTGEKPVSSPSEAKRRKLRAKRKKRK